MEKRNIIRIDEEKCNGCGLCIPNCPEGALQIIDGKARLVSDLFCDGLGACVGHCPTGAMTVEEREAALYDERKVMANIIKQGANVIKAHLEHLESHGETKYLKEAIGVLKDKNIDVPEGIEDKGKNDVDTEQFSGCPGSRVLDLSIPEGPGSGKEEGKRRSQLRQWPVQLHLVPPNAAYFRGKDVVVAADCVAYSLADFHKDYLSGRSLAIACPKLDTGREVYIEKIKAMIDEAGVNTITVMTMEVPCCAGLLVLVKDAAAKASRKVPVKNIVVGIRGDIIREEWV